MTTPATDPTQPLGTTDATTGATPPPGAASVPPVPPSGGARRTAEFWDDVAGLGVVRDRSTGWIGGVCAGVAHRLGVDPLLIRAGVIALTFAGGFGLVAYLVAWLLLPDHHGQILLREVGRGSVTGIVLLATLALLVVTGLSVGDGPWLGGWLVPTAVIAVVALVTLTSRNRPGAPIGAGPPPMSTPSDGGLAMPPTPPSTTPTAPAWTGATAAPHAAAPAAADPSAPAGLGGEAYYRSLVPPVPPVPPVPAARPMPAIPPQPRRRSAPRGTGAVVLGLVILGYGLGLLIADPLGFAGSATFLGLLIALGVTSVAALVLGLSGRRGGIASVLTVLLLFPVAAGAAIEKAPLGPGEGQSVTWAPTESGGYNLGVGEATLDLSPFGSAAMPAPSMSASPSALPGDPASASPSAAATTGESAAATTTAPATRTITASVGTGQLTVLVPKGVEVNVHASVGLGSTDLGPFGTTGTPGNSVGASSWDRTISTADNTTPTTVIDLQLNVGLGDLVFKEI